MTSLKTVVEHRDILNFSRDHISKNFVRQTLKKTQFDHIISDGKKSTIVINHIIVGMYHIHLILDGMGGLKNFGIQISDELRNYGKHINLDKDCRFNNQDWIETNNRCRLTSKHLADIIMHCHRLNKMKAFL